jgi:hypothetical protein
MFAICASARSGAGVHVSTVIIDAIGIVESSTRSPKWLSRRFFPGVLFDTDATGEPPLALFDDAAHES